MAKRLIVGITGATGALYGVRLLERLRALRGWGGHLVLLDAGGLKGRQGLERRRLVLLPREAPLNLAHLRNMVAVTEMGGIVFPPVPAFYQRPKTIDDLVEHTVARVLDLFGVRSPKLRRWAGMKGTPPERG